MFDTCVCVCVATGNICWTYWLDQGEGSCSSLTSTGLPDLAHLTKPMIIQARRDGRLGVTL